MLLELALLLLAFLGFVFCARKAAHQFPNRGALLIFWIIFGIGLMVLAVAGYWTITYIETVSAQTR